MADYKTIHGTLVRSYTADPDNPIDGQVWYDKTAKTLQFEIPNVTSAGLGFGGNDGTADISASEEWSGSSITTKVLTD